MKKRIVSILLMAMMVLGTFSLAVFATEELPAAEPEATEVTNTEGDGTTDAVVPETTTEEEQTPEVKEEPKEEAAADVTVETQDLQDPTPLAAPVLSTFSAYYSVALEWTPVDNAGSYVVYMDGAPVTGPLTATSYIVGGLAEESTHTFSVLAKPEEQPVEPTALENATYAETMSAPVSDGPVRQMYIWIKFKAKAKLKSHDGAKVKHTFKKGEWVRAHGFGGGKYRFYYNGNLFYTSFLRTNKAWAEYTRDFDYSAREAEYFINTSGKGSATGWFLWVNQYTQHVYLLTGSAGNWHVYGEWTCSTGAPKTPSPTGFGKKIYKRVKKRNGHGPWTAFQSWTSFHGTRKSWRKNWDKPVSHACIRCPDEWAKFIYKNIPNGTAVAVY